MEPIKRLDAFLKDVFETGISGRMKVTPADVLILCDIYRGFEKSNSVDFISLNVKRELEKMGFRITPNDVGWTVSV